MTSSHLNASQRLQSLIDRYRADVPISDQQIDKVLRIVEDYRKSVGSLVALYRRESAKGDSAEHTVATLGTITMSVDVVALERKSMLLLIAAAVQMLAEAEEPKEGPRP